jgi:probable addiction module antidote protein
MPRGRWKPSDEQVAQEAFVVLIQGKKPTRTYSKEVLLQSLRDSSVTLDFLKLCLEWDNAGDLQLFKKGLLCVVQARGATALAKSTGVSRVTLYRMLSSSGNPRLSSLTTLFRKLGVRLYLVDEGFIRRREKITRPKDR